MPELCAMEKAGFASSAVLANGTLFTSAVSAGGDWSDDTDLSDETGLAVGALQSVMGEYDRALSDARVVTCYFTLPEARAAIEEDLRFHFGGFVALRLIPVEELPPGQTGGRVRIALEAIIEF